VPRTERGTTGALPTGLNGGARCGWVLRLSCGWCDLCRVHFRYRSM